MNFDRLPIPETDLLDYVEGKLPGTRRVEVAGVLRQHPDLARLVAAMQDDRRVMGSLPMAAAPAGLLEQVEARLEREALLGMNTTAGGEIPVSRLVPERPSVIGRIVSSRGMRRFALAASLALVAGGAAWSITVAVRQMGRTPERLARGTESVTEPEANAGNTMPSEAIEVARVPEIEGDQAVVPDGAAESTRLAMSSEIVGPDPVAAASEFDPTRMTAERALELARQGRLAVVVRCADSAIATKRVERLAVVTKGDGEATRLHRLEAGSLPTAMAALATLWSPRAIEPAAPTAIASDRPTTELAGTEHAPAAVIVGRSQPAAVYAFEIDDEESAVAGLRPSLATDGQNGPRITAEFIKLDEPIEAAPSTDPAAVLWWSGPPAALDVAVGGADCC